MVILEKKERSKELNRLKSTLVGFKTLVSDDLFIITKINGKIHYVFDIRGFFMVSKDSNFLSLENFLEEGEYVNINYSELRAIVGLKKSEITEIRYDTDEYLIETSILEETNQYVIKKSLDHLNELRGIVEMRTGDKLSENFIEVTYDPEEQMLYSKTDNSGYPYKITFSDDINFKLKIDEPESLYYIKSLSDGAFIQVITKSKFTQIESKGKRNENIITFDAQSMLFVFNYLNNRGE